MTHMEGHASGEYAFTPKNSFESGLVTHIIKSSSTSSAPSTPATRESTQPSQTPSSSSTASPPQQSASASTRTPPRDTVSISEILSCRGLFQLYDYLVQHPRSEVCLCPHCMFSISESCVVESHPDQSCGAGVNYKCKKQRQRHSGREVCCVLSGIRLALHFIWLDEGGIDVWYGSRDLHVELGNGSR